MKLILSKEYIQKSRVFLYPALGIKRGHSVTPIQTYVSWDPYIKKEDCKLICLYHLRDDPEFKNLEKQKLIGNELFSEFKFIDEDKGVYIFDFSKMADDWENFLVGKYSKLSPDLKRKIRNFFGVQNQAYIDSYVYPERYFGLYSEMLTCTKEDASKMLSLLKDVGELCSRPDLYEENLQAEIKDLGLVEKNS